MPDLITSLFPYFGLLILFVVVVGAISVFNQKSKPITSYPYQKQNKLFTPAERSFLGVLEQAVSDQYRVFGKVRLADVIEVKSGVSRSVRQSAFNRIQSKHLDYIVCDPRDLSIQFAVELDDSSHSQTKRKNRDAFVDQALRVAKVPLFRFPAKQAYSVREVRSVLFDDSVKKER
jgi:hypothetical protein